MWKFISSFIIFISLWLILIVENMENGGIELSLFMLAGSLACFFFLSKKHPPFFLFVLLSCTIMLYGFFSAASIYTLLLLLLVSIIASAKVTWRQFYLLLGFHVVYTTALLWLQQRTSYLPWIFIIAACCYFLVALFYKQKELTRQRSLYENMLAEFRQMKRMHISKEEIAKAEERTRIAREIHDSVGHRLTALMMKIEMLYVKDRDEALLELKQMAEESLQETREAVSALETSEAMGIAAIVQLIRKLEAESQLMIEFTIKEGVLSIPLSNEQGIVLYRVIQEALTNVMRHSTSKLVQIEIGKTATKGIQFIIKNPLNSKVKYGEGFGIRNMRSRITELGGRLDVHQAENSFIVAGNVPI